MLSQPKPSPYPGPRPFEESEQRIFFGRKREVIDITSLIMAHKVVLLYAPSGAGKTSLLNAGVVPSLRRDKLTVLPLARVAGSIPDSVPEGSIPNFFTYNTLLCWKQNEEAAHSPGSMTIPDFFQNLNDLRSPDESALPRIATFDQFEELFTSYPEHWRQREDFFRQVADALAQDAFLRIVFTIREDYLASLESYADILPDRLHWRYRIDLLNRQAACLAIEKPLETTDYSFSDGAVEKLVDELLKVRVKNASGKSIEVLGEFVEPVQLQVVCQNLLKNLPPNTTKIQAKDIQAFGDVDLALQRFYEQALYFTCQETRVPEQKLREWFNHQLITPADTRGTVFQDETLTGGLPNDAVRLLEKEHLIRGELRAGAHWYELTHDRFIGPIQISNKAWRSRHAREVQNRKLRLVAISGSFVFLLIVISLTVYSLRVRAQLTQQAQEAMQLSAAILTSQPLDIIGNYFD